MFYLIGFVLWIVFAAAVGMRAEQRGRSFGGWVLLSILISPLLAVLLLVILPYHSQRPRLRVINPPAAFGGWSAVRDVGKVLGLIVLAVVAVVLLLSLFVSPTPAAAQTQPGPNLSPNGIPFTFSPRFGYLGPPAAFVPGPPPPRPRYYRPGSMPIHAAPPEAAPPPAPLLATHNGSLMEVTPLDGNLVEIRYADPRPGLWGVGVRPGTVLIRGQWLGDRLEAAAHVFTAGCGPIPYAVAGGADANGVLTLTGPAPIVDPYSCFVLGLAWTGNSTLVFVPASPPPPVARLAR